MKELERPIVPTELITAAKSVYAQELTTIRCKQSAYITHLEMKLKNHGVSHHVSLSDAQKYAEFCVECDRKGLPLLLVQDWKREYSS